MKREPCQLYLVTPPKIDLARFEDAMMEAVKGGLVASVQLRLKDVDDDQIRAATETLLPIAHAYDTAFIINDRPDLAAELGADGVHIGQEDASYQSARELLGDAGIIGVTCHDSRHLAMQAADQGADYVAFGAFFPTDTKTPKTRADAEILKWWQDMFVIPCVAIGGINPSNCGPLVAAGADFLAVVSTVWDHPDGPAAGVKALHEAMTASSD